jgi:hypothetical protein
MLLSTDSILGFTQHTVIIYSGLLYTSQVGNWRYRYSVSTGTPSDVYAGAVFTINTNLFCSRLVKFVVRIWIQIQLIFKR